MRFSVLLWSKIIQRIRRTLFIEKHNVVVNFLLYWFFAGAMEVHKQLSFNPAVNGLHGSIIRRRAFQRATWSDSHTWAEARYTPSRRKRSPGHYEESFCIQDEFS